MTNDRSFGDGAGFTSVGAAASSSVSIAHLKKHLVRLSSSDGSRTFKDSDKQN